MEFEVPKRTDLGERNISVLANNPPPVSRRYTSQELKYFPINTAIYNPPRPLKCLYPDPNQPSEEETEEEKEERKSGSSEKGENESSSSVSQGSSALGISVITHFIKLHVSIVNVWLLHPSFLQLHFLARIRSFSSIIQQICITRSVRVFGKTWKLYLL